MATRCRYSDYGRERLRPQRPDREGNFLGYVSGDIRRSKVRWDGLATIAVYCSDFIELIPEEKVCVLDLSRAPFLASVFLADSDGGE